VTHQDDRRGGCVDQRDDGSDVLGQADAGAIGVRRPDARQRHCHDVVAVRLQRRRDVVPRPRAEPETGNQDDRHTAHGRRGRRQITSFA
jgi:hypothetical protein